MAGGKITGRRAAGWLAAVCLAFSCCVPAAAETAAGEVFVSERISRNYTKVSAGYTLPAYTGEDIRLVPEEAVTDAGSAEWTGETMGYPGTQVLRVHYGDTVRMKAEIPEDAQLRVVEIPEGSDLWEAYRKQTAAALGTDDVRLPGLYDITIIDAEGNIFIRGRSKNMILGPSGQNIYPEELEAVVNNQPFVLETVVVDRGGKLVALVFPDEQAIAKALLDTEAKADIPENIRLGANRQLPPYSQIAKVELMDKPFEKTPKMSIRRFLYK